MTETTTRIEQAGAHGPELSGVDLARVALHAAGRPPASAATAR